MEGWREGGEEVAEYTFRGKGGNIWMVLFEYIHVPATEVLSNKCSPVGGPDKELARIPSKNDRCACEDAMTWAVAVLSSVMVCKHWAVMERTERAISLQGGDVGMQHTVPSPRYNVRNKAGMVQIVFW